jgi:hypothetical protein
MLRLETMACQSVLIVALTTLLAIGAPETQLLPATRERCADAIAFLESKNEWTEIERDVCLARLATRTPSVAVQLVEPAPPIQVQSHELTYGLAGVAIGLVIGVLGGAFIALAK